MMKRYRWRDNRDHVAIVHYSIDADAVKRLGKFAVPDARTPNIVKHTRLDQRRCQVSKSSAKAVTGDEKRTARRDILFERCCNSALDQLNRFGESLMHESSRGPRDWKCSKVGQPVHQIGCSAKD